MSGTVLQTAAAVLDELGGNIAVARLTRSKAKAVSNWRAFNAFPPRTFLAIQAALSDKGKQAPSSLWGMIDPFETRSAHQPMSAA